MIELYLISVVLCGISMYLEYTVSTNYNIGKLIMFIIICIIPLLNILVCIAMTCHLTEKNGILDKEIFTDRIDKNTQKYLEKRKEKERKK